MLIGPVAVRRKNALSILRMHSHQARMWLPYNIHKLKCATTIPTFA